VYSKGTIILALISPFPLTKVFLFHFCGVKSLQNFSEKEKVKQNLQYRKKQIPKISQFFFQENDKIWGGTSPHSFAARSEGV
jgi:hypothetical protein